MAPMESISHRTITANGVKIHIAEKGKGPIILLIHGFPELWYTWRHQISSLANLGFRAVAPDLRGYGDSDSPPSPSSYTIFHIVGDLVAVIDAVCGDSGEKVFVVGHDWGSIAAWYLSLFRPDRVRALVSLSVPFNPRNPRRVPIPAMRSVCGDDYYICRFQVPGEIEPELAKFGTERVLKEFLTYRAPRPFFLPKGQCFEQHSEIKLPNWLSEEDLQYYVAKFEKTGFTGGINYYRNIDRNWELTAPWTGSQIKVPVKFIVGDLDLVYNSFAAKEYIHKGGFKKDVPFLEEVVVMEGVGHFINEEKPEEITQHIYEFFSKF